MLSLNLSSLRGSAGDAATTPATCANGGNPPAGASDPAGFAALLRQTQVAPAPAPVAPVDAHASHEPVPEHDAPDEAPPPRESSDAASRHRALKGKLRPTDGTAVPMRDAHPAPAAHSAQDKADAATRADAAAADTTEKR
ncbi:MAG TPA: hypothetical protein VFA35_06950, partial [Burkholderiaceae bacterium]|nr:hypothetical protein [Burkholderiaceae bacterium]